MNPLTCVCIAVACFGLSGCATGKKSIHAGDSLDRVTTIRISANVDGSGRFIFTPEDVRYEHKFWSPPSDVAFNGEPWTDLDQSPPGWRDLGRQLDLSRAQIVERRGRDVIALEQTENGFDLYLCDSPNGSEEYGVTIAIPRRGKASSEIK